MTRRLLAGFIISWTLLCHACRQLFYQRCDLDGNVGERRVRCPHCAHDELVYLSGTPVGEATAESAPSE